MVSRKTLFSFSLIDDCKATKLYLRNGSAILCQYNRCPPNRNKQTTTLINSGASKRNTVSCCTNQ